MTDPVPSKEQIAKAWDEVSGLVEFAYEQGFHELGYNPLNLLDGAMANQTREIERLRTTLTGISTCGTCEACRGAALRALGEEA